jgi:hypothetical protein
MIHPNAELRFINEEIGYGVFATALIPMGTMTYVKDPLEVEVGPDTFSRYTKELREVVEKYSYIDERGVRILSWDHAKYVNHCCQCNSMSTGYGFEIAIRDIFPGEEITDEYGLLNIEHEMELSCNKPGCRAKVCRADWDPFMEGWDEKVRNALLRFHLVDQPLASLLDSKTRKQLDLFLEGGEKYLSVAQIRLKEG